MEAISNKTPPSFDISPSQRVLSSLSGAVVTSIFVTPFDVVKVRLQSQTSSKRGSHPRSCLSKFQGSRVSLMTTKVTPFDVVKVRLQAQKHAQQRTGVIPCNSLMNHACHVHRPGECSKHTCAAMAPARPWYCTRPGKFSGTFDALTRIARTEGVRTLWSGLSPTLVMAVPSNVVYFTMYDSFKYQLGFREDDPSTKYIPVVAGSSARSLTTILVTPLELLRTKLQSEPLSYRELGQVVRNAVVVGGAGSLLRGLGPTLLRDIPFSAVYWFTYEELKALQLGHDNIKPNMWQTFCAGAGAGSLAGLLTQPFDVVKTQRQIALGRADFGKDKLVSTWQLTAELYQSGLRSLYAGLLPRLLRIAPACAIMITSYEYCKAFFYDYNLQYYYANQLPIPVTNSYTSQEFKN